jgi:oligopeptide/dipeptide ABC transporter ATP-binding protein
VSVETDSAPHRLVLDVRGLTVSFESLTADDSARRVALSNVSLDVRAGEIMGLVGESGCGKSLTGLAVMGLLPRTARVTSGSVLLDTTNLTEASPRRVRSLRGQEMAMVFQEPMVALNPLMRVGKQIEEVLAIHGIGTRAERRQRAVTLLGDVGLTNPKARTKQYPHELSGGMRQRVMIAMALAAEPGLIVADEPTTALDVTVQSQVLQLLSDIRDSRETAVLLVTHDMGVIAEVADRVSVMYAGTVVEVSSVDDLFHRPQHPYTEGLLASIPGRATHSRDGQELPTIPGQVPELGLIPPGCPFAPRCRRANAVCEAQRPQLELRLQGHYVACWHPAVAADVTALAGSQPTDGEGT